MSRNYKHESMNEFNRHAKDYDDNSPFYYKMTRFCDNAVMDRISSFRARPKAMLDVGCGTGVMLQKLSLRYPESRLFGLDLSERMIEICRQKNIQNAEFVQGDSEHLPYDDNFFDITLCCSSFHHYPNPDKVLKEFHRVLKKSGTLLICDIALNTPARLLANHVLFKILRTGDYKIYSRHEIIARMKNAGFHACHYEKIPIFEFLSSGKK